MKRISFLLFGLALLLQSCLKDQVYRKTTVYVPQYKTKQAVIEGIASGTPVPLSSPGKIFYKDGFVFLNELNKGIHIIDVKNPAAPNNIAFVNIPGSVDMAVRGNTLYADMYTDLVAIDISNPKSVKVSSILPGVFPQRYYWGFNADSNMIITDWVAVDTVLQEGQYFSWGVRRDVLYTAVATASSGVSNGTGGSMARFALSSDRLYTVDNSDLRVFDVAAPEKPSFVNKVSAGGWGIETIYPFGKNLFIGSMTGMFIFDISDKNKPIQLGTFSHARVCDPVISDGTYAYVTLRSGSTCQGFNNQLDVVDIAYLSKPSLLKTYPLTNPHGLSKEGNVLVICDGADGVKFFDATNVKNILPLSQVKGMNAYDVITIGTIAIVSAQDALYLIDFSNPAKPAVKSTINISPNKN